VILIVFVIFIDRLS